MSGPSQSNIPSVNPPQAPTPRAEDSPPATTPPLAGNRRTPRPENVKMPSNPFDRLSGRPVSPSAGKPSTPTGQAESPGSNSGLSPSMTTGPLSPNANPNSSSFIFPIRSVFRDMEPQQGPSSQGTQLGRVPSRGQGTSRSPGRQAQNQGPSTQSNPIVGDIDDDGGIQSIAQMLHRNDQKDEHAKLNRTSSMASGAGGPGTGGGQMARATFGGKSGEGQPKSAGGVDNDSIVAPQGFFSLPIIENESSKSMFFQQAEQQARRASDGNDSPNQALQSLPELSEESADTPEDQAAPAASSSRPSQPDSKPHNPSTEAPGSGLTNPERPPVGVPQEEPKGINFRHRPGPDKEGRENQFSTVHDNKSTTRAEPESEDTPPGSGLPANVETTHQPSAQAPQGSKAALQQPQPSRVGKGGLQGLTPSDSSPSDSSASSRRATSQSNLEQGDDGGLQLVHDFASIIHLGEAGSLSSIGGTRTGTGTGEGTGEASRAGTGNRSRASRLSSNNKSGNRDQPSGPTTGRLAQQARDSRRTSTRDTVRDFVNEQANTVNLPDPNAPTPSPAPAAAVEGDEAGPSSRSEKRGSISEGQGYATESSDSISARDSSEVATVSGEDRQTESEDEEPITTFRFEHVSTNDGHHVVVGREGKLRSCEDEPITTPGAVQGFGVLIVLEEDWDTGSYSVRQVSENATELMGLSPKYLFALDCFTQILTEEQEELFRESMEYLPDADTGQGALQEEGPQVFLLSGFGEDNHKRRPSTIQEEDDGETMSTYSTSTPLRREWLAWCAAHRPAHPKWNKQDEHGAPVEPPNLIILEFELEHDAYNPLMGPFSSSNYSGGDTPDSNAGSQTTLSAGSRPDLRSYRTSSTGSGQATSFTGSTTTMGSTPKPAASQTMETPTGSQAPTERVGSDGAAGSGSDSNAAATVTQTTQSGRYSVPSFSSRNRSAQNEPMGLEGIDVEQPLERILESTTNYAKPLRALQRMRGYERPNAPGGPSSPSVESATPSGRGRPGRGRGRGSHGRGVGGGFGMGGRVSGGLGGGSTGHTGFGGGSGGGQSTASGTMDVFAVLGQINDQLAKAANLEEFLRITVGVVQDVCRFHRVLIYQFDETFNGQVVAELVEWGKTTDLYKGLMFPAADIPAQARELYKINKVRLLYDRDQTTARMVLRSREDLDHPLDMTHCFLRAMSPIHIKYLANMHVRSSMSVSIMAFGQLWGLIACHSYGHHGMRVSFPVRQMMRILSDAISRNIERLSYAQRLHTRKLISTIPSQHHPTGYIVSNADDLLQIFDADCGLLVIGEGCKLLGRSDQGQAMLAIAEFLRIMRFDVMKASNHLQKDLPDLVLPRAQDTIAGMLYVPLTAAAGKDFIVFLRKGQVREVHWAGKPYKDEQTGESASLEPRKSFKTWSETVTGRSRIWTDDQLESAGVLALIYGKFIQVWREKQHAMANNQLTAILLSNTSHAVRTPLSQIINTLELALSGNIDPDVRSMLENSHQASRALLFHVHDLLDLTRIETGNETAFNDPFDLRQTIQDTVRLYQTETTRRGLEFRLNLAPNLPQFVIGDSRKIKTVVSNLVANAVKFTDEGFVEVTVKVQNDEGQAPVVRSGQVPLELIVGDSGCGISPEKLEAMFVSLEGADEVVKGERTGLGLGLAVVARIVEQLQAQLRCESEVDVGSNFFFTLSMPVSDGTRPPSRPSSKDSVVQHRPRTGSSGSNSVVSLRSSESHPMSEIDSFVQDFGQSHMFAPVAADDVRLKDAETRMNRPGTFPVTDSSWPVRPARADDTEASVGSSNSQSPVEGSLALSPNTSGRTGLAARSINYRSPQASIGPAPGSRQGTGSSRDLGPQSAAQAYAKQFQGSPNPQGEPSSPQVPSPRPSEDHRGSADTDNSLTPGAYIRTDPFSRFQEIASPLSDYTPPDPKSDVSPGGTRNKKGPNGESVLRVLVVEDDAINSQILQKRLKMDKHSVVVANNGQEGVDAVQKDWDIDAILMDIQMPIMDGRMAAKTIRRLEADTSNPPPRSEAGGRFNPLRVDGRIPIFAVSASLYESDRFNLAEDFDGWLLKPLDFNRVRKLLAALEDPEKRLAEVHVQGQWERGGFFHPPPGKSPSPPRVDKVG